MPTPNNLYQLRLALAGSRAKLREAEIKLALTRAQAEETAIQDAWSAHKTTSIKPVEKADALGTNETERKRALLLRLESDRPFCDARERVDALTQEIELLQAQIRTLEDERQDRVTASRERIARILESAFQVPPEQSQTNSAVDALAERELDLQAAKAGVDRLDARQWGPRSV